VFNQIAVNNPRGVHGGLPSYFRACCYTASLGVRGNSGGYFGAGRTLGSSLSSEMPYDLEDDEWQTEVETLEEFLAAGDDDGAWSWFKTHFPRCMAIVPPRRKDRFLAGVRAAYEDEGFGF
jgi:hypothetical protein